MEYEFDLNIESRISSKFGMKIGSKLVTQKSVQIYHKICSNFAPKTVIDRHFKKIKKLKILVSDLGQIKAIKKCVG